MMRRNVAGAAPARHRAGCRGAPRPHARSYALVYARAVMNMLRLSAAAVVVAAVLIAAALGACDPGAVISVCNIPTVNERAADGGPDPCHCDPPPALNITGCPCLSDPTNQDAIDDYGQCFASFLDEEDAGLGGPLTRACTGGCWPIPPLGWTQMALLWVGAESNAPPCPPSAPAVLYGGYGPGTFAIACTSNASGSCPDLGDVCGPTAGEGFWACVYREGNDGCPLLGPYTEDHVFYEASGQPSQPSTFCCLPSPAPAP